MVINIDSAAIKRLDKMTMKQNRSEEHTSELQSQR